MPPSELPSILLKLLFIAALVAVLSVQSASAQTNSASSTGVPKYDLKSETKIKGTVEEVKLPAKSSEKEAVRLTVKNATETVDVYLCPGSFLDDMGISFKKGDEIALTGSKVKQDTSELILAREVVKGTDTLVLRDEKGNPVWNWHK